MQRTNADLGTPAFRVYHSGASSVTAATVEVTAANLILKSTSASTITTTTTSLTASATDTLTELVAAVNAISGWVARLDGNGEAASSDLVVTPVQSCYTATEDRQLTIVDTILVTALIRGVSDQIEAICNRAFASTSYASWVDGKGETWLYLPQAPLTAVQRVSVDTVNGLSITNGTTTHSLATVAVTSTGVETRHYDSAGTLVSNSATFASNATLTLMAAAITAFGGGWSASVSDTSLGSRRAATLRPCGHRDALGVTNYLAVADDPLDDFTTDDNGGMIESSATFAEGNQNVYVEYTAGYSTVPYPIQEICGELVAEAYNVMRTGYGLIGGALGNYAVQFNRASQGFDVNRPEIIKRLMPWIRSAA